MNKNICSVLSLTCAFSFLISCAYRKNTKIAEQHKAAASGNVNSHSFFAITKLNEIKQHDTSYTLYNLYEELNLPPTDTNDSNIKIVPMKGYVFDWTNYNNNTEHLEKFLVPDSTYLGVMEFYKDSLLGFIPFHKLNSRWKDFGIIPFKENRSSPFFTTYLMCQRNASEVFTIRYNKATDFMAWGFYKDGKLNVIKYLYGQIAHYTDFDQWAMKMIPSAKK
ncbi:MAG TPA: hypothetical protein VGB71_03815 [Flavisolibacter sp.]